MLIVSGNSGDPTLVHLGLAQQDMANWEGTLQACAWLGRVLHSPNTSINGIPQYRYGTLIAEFSITRRICQQSPTIHATSKLKIRMSAPAPTKRSPIPTTTRIISASSGYIL
ncbi:hypothetical protein HZ326_10902 [Fusarium oxysporum f. sp. albedinis]|nr:hypothetical protein HZ326_10902 [Fusarium oxysporum f. sp. albedinis]